MDLNRILREGFIAGCIGAASVAVWFLIVDTINGQPLFTPAMLGSAVFWGAPSPDPTGAPSRRYWSTKRRNRTHRRTKSNRFDLQEQHTEFFGCLHHYRCGSCLNIRMAGSSRRW